MYPRAKLTGIRFGLTSNEEILKTSIFEREPRSADVCDSRLGLPNADSECMTCGEKQHRSIMKYGSNKCGGHFGHIMLPCEVYHPNYVRKVADIFNKICLKCLSLKVEKKNRPNRQIQEFMAMIDEMDDSEFCIRQNNVPPVKGNNGDFLSTSSNSSRATSVKGKQPDDARGMQTSSNGESSVNSDVTAGLTLALQITDGVTRSQKSIEKGTAVLDKKVNNCKYCKQRNYPRVNFKVEGRNHEKGQRKNNVVEKIRLEFQDDEQLLPDYLKILGKVTEDFDNGPQYLLPSEALEVLRKLSDEVVACLKLDNVVARPEAFVLQSMFMPPNCNRITERPGGSSWKYGSDEATKRLRTIARFKGKSTSKLATTASTEELQSHISHYFRSKGAPKVKGNREPITEYTRNGQSKKEVKLFGRNKLQDLLVAKTSDFSARAVLTGDAFLSLDEIGIPVEISKYLTIDESITRYNYAGKQKEYSNADGDNKIMQYTRSGISRLLGDNESYTMEIGDVIGRPMVDGDVILCNRPPSIHKHSLIGLKVKLTNIQTFSINPLLCPPLGADFDGDCLAIFVPQSIQAKAEAEMVMAHNQMVTSHGGHCTFGLTQDSFLSAHLLLNSPLFMKREIMEMGCIWSDSPMPKPAIVKSPEGAFFTSTQFFQLPFPAGMDYSEHGLHISNSEIMESTWDSRNWNAFLQLIIEKHGYKVALNYLGSSQRMLVQWLSHRGFSTGLRDVYETCAPNTREVMKNKIRRMVSGIDAAIAKFVPKENSLMKMVTAGSKGSLKLFVEQFASIGLKPLRRNHKYKYATDEGRCISNSFVDGLTLDEFMIQTLSYRDTAIYQGLKLSEPGLLFKNLMLFARDVYVCYDGVVRSNHNRRIFQFLYGGYKDSVPSLAGEAVGILAATAIVQPAYEMLLESSKASVDNSGISPLEYLQETLYCRKVLKQNDRKVILYMVDPAARAPSSALQIRKILQPVNLDMIRMSTTVFYEGGSGSWEGLLTAENSPWVVHLSLSTVAMASWSLSVKEIAQRLKTSSMLQALSVSARVECNSCCPGWSPNLQHVACISFCINDRLSSAEKSLSSIIKEVIPYVHKASIIGDSRIEYVSILPSSESWAAFNWEIAIEIVVKKTSLKNKTDAWQIVKDICLPVFHLIDWSRSMPCSVEGIAKIYGIEAAHRMVFQRLRNILSMLEKNIYREHALLITDIMTHVGSVIGLTPSGLQDFMNRTHVSAPLTRALFGNLVQHMQNAASQGKWDDLSGTLASTSCGKLAPVGTGANFELLWRAGGSSY